MMYEEIYYHILTVMAAMLQQYGSSLGLLAPGYPEQLRVQDWIKVHKNRTGYCVRVVRDSNFSYHNKPEFLNAVQVVLNRFCYQNGINRIFVVDAKVCPGNVIALAICV